jgi:hypothetical protein
MAGSDELITKIRFGYAPFNVTKKFNWPLGGED